MKEPLFSPMAVEDLEGILDYITRDNPPAAIRFVETLKEKCNTLARFPLLGASRDQLVEGLRVYSAGNYAIYYRPEADTVRIERILHGARDADALFG
ncbi:MAG: type II toxin-antitoxin system RelE/ParE family toxin [Planctomycetota bacterium]|jgi:toxin ParE1/3/4